MRDQDQARFRAVRFVESMLLQLRLRLRVKPGRLDVIDASGCNGLCPPGCAPCHDIRQMEALSGITVGSGAA